MIDLVGCGSGEAAFGGPGFGEEAVFVKRYEAAACGADTGEGQCHILAGGQLIGSKDGSEIVEQVDGKEGVTGLGSFIGKGLTGCTDAGRQAGEYTGVHTNDHERCERTGAIVDEINAATAYLPDVQEVAAH